MALSQKRWQIWNIEVCVMISIALFLIGINNYVRLIAANDWLHILLCLFGFAFRSGSVGSSKVYGKSDTLETYLQCTKSALVVSEVFCLPKDYRKDVPPPSKFYCVIHVLIDNCKTKLSKGPEWNDVPKDENFFEYL